MRKISLGNCKCSRWETWREWLFATKDVAAVSLEVYSQEIAIADGLQQQMNATARNRMRYALAHGYLIVDLGITGWNENLVSIFAINTSADIRQGRLIGSSLLERPKALSSDGCSGCDVSFVGVVDQEGILVAYATLHHVGNMSAATRFVGHAKWLRDGITPLLWRACVERAVFHKSDFLIYSKWSDGLDSLRYWKHSVGLSSMKFSVTE